MSVAQELAAASGVPPAFRKQLESCSTFCKSESAGGRAGGIAVRCVALRRTMESFDGNDAYAIDRRVHLLCM